MKYYAGYNRGFLRGISNKQAGSKGSSSSSYSKSSYQPVKSWSPDFDLYERTLRESQRRYDNQRIQQQQKQEQQQRLDAAVAKFTNPQAISIRYAYINLIDQLWRSKSDQLPSYLEDGIYNAIIVTSQEKYKLMKKQKWQ